MKITVGTLRQVIKETIENEQWVLERSGVSWSQKFFVDFDGMDGKWSLPRHAKKFNSYDEAVATAKRIDREIGFRVRPSPVNIG